MRGVVARSDLPPETRGQISGAFEEQFTLGTVTPEEIMHIREALDVWYVERDLYTGQAAQQVKRGFSVRAEVRNPDMHRSRGQGFNTVWIAGFENNTVDATLLGEADLPKFRKEL